MLTLTPVVCVLASIGFSVTFDNYLHFDGIPVEEEEEEEEDTKNKEEKEIVDKKKVLSGIVMLCHLWFLLLCYAIC